MMKQVLGIAWQAVLHKVQRALAAAHVSSGRHERLRIRPDMISPD
jgi:hypothetical protein